MIESRIIIMWAMDFIKENNPSASDVKRLIRKFEKEIELLTSRTQKLDDALALLSEVNRILKQSKND